MILPGDRVRVTANIRDRETNTLVDPATVVLTVKDPSNSTTTPAVTNLSVGVYYADVDIPSSADSTGQWFVRWVSTANGSGFGHGAEESGFIVGRSSFL